MIGEIAELCDQREYVKANDIYLKMSIGNATWPMGVTMVGIHERSGREKIHTANVARILPQIFLTIPAFSLACRSLSCLLSSFFVVLLCPL